MLPRYAVESKEEATFVDLPKEDHKRIGRQVGHEPESQLKKKHLSICYHAVRESIAAGWLRVGWVPSGSNLSDPLTKLMSGRSFARLLESIYINCRRGSRWL
mmetsp:Transcript_28745/g.63277  ORF Transcript_28745/g.63277 Transcript_28745/m.63277 type:complete len:102 (+) Transcript_28745:726-1031(+)